MDLVSLLAILGGFVAILSVMVSFFLFLINKIDVITQEMKSESKDFHARLCVIEERSRK